VGPTSPPIRYTPLDIRRRQSGRNVKVTSHLHLVARLRLRGAIPPLPYMPLCLVLKLITDTNLQSPGRSVNYWRDNPWPWYYMELISQTQVLAALAPGYHYAGSWKGLRVSLDQRKVPAGNRFAGTSGRNLVTVLNEMISNGI